MNHIKILFLLFASAIIGCSKENTPAPVNNTMYFPPTSGSNWETATPASLGWNTSAIQPLKDYLAAKNTKSFMILVNGRIVMEEYFNGHTPTTQWKWNSAGKTLTAAMIGMAQQEGLLNIGDRANKYLGLGWTSAPLAKENLITVRHLLTMTSGLSDSSDFIIKPNLTYMADAGTRWSYNNVFQKLMDITTSATGQDYKTYFASKLRDRIGMDGNFNEGLIFTIYSSNTRSMARWGLLALNNGKWNNEQLLNANYFIESTTTSQNINPSYGYLWWLNGKTSYMVPGGQTVYQGTLVPNAPADMYAAMGAEDQRIYVVPGRKMVVIRMGDASDPQNPNFALSGFDNAIWEKINAVIK